MTVTHVPGAWRWAGIALIAVTGLLHLIEMPEYFEAATYLGLLFLLNGLGAVVAGVGIARGARDWGWALGLVVAGGALAMYVVSRAFGLPGLSGKAWFEPIAMLAFAAEGLFVALALASLARRPGGELVARGR
jgi:hypothetical protein